MKLLLLLLPVFLSAQTIEHRIDSIVRAALDERLIQVDVLVNKIDSVVRAVYGGEQPAEPEETAPVETKGFIWIDTQTGNVLGRVGGPVTLPGAATIHTFGVSGPVTFRLSGPISTTRDEGAEPFSLFGDIGNKSTGRLFPLGNYEITATYPGGSLKASFQVR